MRTSKEWVKGSLVMSVQNENLIVGSLYKVSAEDCCVEVYFTAFFLGLGNDSFDQHENYPKEYWLTLWDNGVKIKGTAIQAELIESE